MKRLFDALGGDENVCCIEHDSYYRNLSNLSPEERELANFDHPSSLETELLVEHLKCLKSGRQCCIPVYDFSSHSRLDRTVEKVSRRIILLDGILLFTHPELTKELDIKVYVVSWISRAN